MITALRIVVAALAHRAATDRPTGGIRPVERRRAGQTRRRAVDEGRRLFSSRETLADYGHHRFRLLYRDADGAPEQHDAIVDVVIVKSGEGTLQLGIR